MYPYKKEIKEDYEQKETELLAQIKKNFDLVKHLELEKEQV